MKVSQAQKFSGFEIIKHDFHEYSSQLCITERLGCDGVKIRGRTINLSHTNGDLKSQATHY